MVLCVLPDGLYQREIMSDKKTISVSVRFTAVEVDELGAVARRLGWSRAKLIRVITQRFMIEHRDKDVATVLIGQMND